MQNDNVADLIVRCMRDDDEAQALFYTLYLDTVRRSVVRRLQMSSSGAALMGEADDVANEVFARIFADHCRALRTVRNPESIRAWLVTIAGHCAVDYMRKWAGRTLANSDRVNEPEAVYGALCEDKVIESERDAVLSKCLAALPDEECLIVTLFYLHGRKYVEIAEMTGKNINTVSAKLRRAKSKLKRLVEEENYESPY